MGWPTLAGQHQYHPGGELAAPAQPVALEPRALKDLASTGRAWAGSPWGCLRVNKNGSMEDNSFGVWLLLIDLPQSVPLIARNAARSDGLGP